MKRIIELDSDGEEVEESEDEVEESEDEDEEAEDLDNQVRSLPPYSSITVLITVVYMFACIRRLPASAKHLSSQLRRLRRSRSLYPRPRRSPRHCHIS